MPVGDIRHTLATRLQGLDPQPVGQAAAPAPPPVRTFTPLPPGAPGVPGESVYQQLRRHTATIQQGAEYQETLQFPVRTVLCQNFSNQYAWCQEANRFIVPWEVGGVFYADNSQGLHILWTPPQGTSQPSTPVGYLYVMACEAPMSPVPGLLIPSGFHP